MWKALRESGTHEFQTSSIHDLENEIVRGVSALKNPTTEALRNVRRSFSKQLSKAPPEFVVKLATKLVLGGVVPRFLAYEVVLHHKAALASLNAKSLETLGRGNDTWDKVDAFACYLSGPAWRERQVLDALIKRWARSANRWWRRSAVVSTVPLNNKARGGTGDTKRTLLICAMLIVDRDDMVVKAVSWALRELSKRDPDSVRQFLQQHDGRLAARVVREVNNKLQSGLKNPRKQKT